MSIFYFFTFSSITLNATKYSVASTRYKVVPVKVFASNGPTMPPTLHPVNVMECTLDAFAMPNRLTDRSGLPVIQNNAPRIPNEQTKWYAALRPILSDSVEKPRRPPELDKAVPERIAAIAVIPSALSKDFSWEMMDRPHEMLTANMNQIDHHSLLFSNSLYLNVVLPNSVSAFGYFLSSSDDMTITAAYTPPIT